MSSIGLVMKSSENAKLELKIKRLENDIHELKQKLAENRSLEAQLFHSQKMEALAHLAGGIAHDFNNILQCILGYTEIALFEKSEQNSDYEFFKKIESHVKRGCRLTEQFLSFGRRIEPKLKPTNLNSIVGNLKHLLKQALPKMIAVDLKLASDLKTIKADQGQCEQIMMNLCINARDAMAENGQLTIKTENCFLESAPEPSLPNIPPGEFVCLSVSDNGPGIPPKVQRRMYDPFFTTKAKGKGTGLGLSMVYAIVKNHGGFITCESEMNVGTTFRIYLPTACEKEHHQEPIEGKSNSVSLCGDERILFIEDESDILATIQRYLKTYGYDVVTAQSGEEGLAKYLKNRFDLVVMDLGMPGMGGMKCLEQILARDSNAKIVIVSGYRSDRRIDDALEAGAIAFLEKPMSLPTLTNTVRTILNHHTQTAWKEQKQIPSFKIFSNGKKIPLGASGVC